MLNQAKTQGDKSPEALVNANVKVASLPDVVFRMDEAISNPYSNLSDIADIILEDSGLAARLLRIANSTLYSTPSKIDTITRAITIIGTKQLRDLVLATMVIKQFDGISSEAVTMESFWRHSIACGLAARVIATYCRKSNIEHFYLLGLLHDIGRLIIYLEVPNLAREAMGLCQTEGQLLYEAEKMIIGFDHSSVSGALLKKWKLPDSLEEPVSYHHDPINAKHYPDDTAILHIADVIANALKLGSSGEKFVPSIVPEAWSRIGLSVAMLDPIINQIDQQYSNAVDLFLDGA